MGLVSELAVESYCFRYFKENERVPELVKECGLSNIELCFAHVDYSDTASYERVIDAYKNAGVDIISIYVSGLGNDEAAQTVPFEFAAAAGAKHMTVDFQVGSFPESFRIAERLAHKYDVILGIHNHGGIHWLGSSQMLEYVFANTSDRIGLCLDTGWAIDSHEDPAAMARRFADRLHALHLRDFVFDRAGEPEDVTVGTGNLDLARLHDALQAIHFSGSVILEYGGDPEDPLPALKRCVEMIRNTL